MGADDVPIEVHRGRRTIMSSGRKRLSDTTKIVSLMTRPGVGLVKGQVTGRENRNWLLYRSLKSFSIKTDEQEVLVTLPMTAKLDLDIGSEVWVMGESRGLLRFHAEMIFLPRLQQGIDLTKGNGYPTRSIATLALVALRIFIQNVMWVIYYIGIPAILALLVYSYQSTRPRRCSYEAWEIVELRSRNPNEELPQVEEEWRIPREFLGLLALCGWLLIPLAVSVLITPYFWYERGLGWVIGFGTNLIILFLLTSTAVDLTWEAGTRKLPAFRERGEDANDD